MLCLTIMPGETTCIVNDATGEEVRLTSNGKRIQIDLTPLKFRDTIQFKIAGETVRVTKTERDSRGGLGIGVEASQIIRVYRVRKGV